MVMSVLMESTCRGDAGVCVSVCVNFTTCMSVLQMTVMGVGMMDNTNSADRHQKGRLHSQLKGDNIQTYQTKAKQN